MIFPPPLDSGINSVILLAIQAPAAIRATTSYPGVRQQSKRLDVTPFRRQRLGGRWPTAPRPRDCHMQRVGVGEFRADICLIGLVTRTGTHTANAPQRATAWAGYSEIYRCVFIYVGLNPSN
jgi:hypothetical protein